jgi:hypothetical protein
MKRSRACVINISKAAAKLANGSSKGYMVEIVSITLKDGTVSGTINAKPSESFPACVPVILHASAKWANGFFLMAKSLIKTN